MVSGSLALLYLPCFSWGKQGSGPNRGQSFLESSLKPEAWLAGPQAGLAGPQAWLARPQAWLAGPQAWLASPQALLDGPEGGRIYGRTDRRTYG